MPDLSLQEKEALAIQASTKAATVERALEVVDFKAALEEKASKEAAFCGKSFGGRVFRGSFAGEGRESGLNLGCLIGGLLAKNSTDFGLFKFENKQLNCNPRLFDIG